MNTQFQTLRCGKHPGRHVHWIRSEKAEKWVYCPYCGGSLLRKNVSRRLYRLAQTRYAKSNVLIEKFYLEILGLSRRTGLAFIRSGLKPHQVLATRDFSKLNPEARIGKIRAQELDDACERWENAH